ncbi:MAG: DUF4192 domain-containing protein [Propionibacteriaceae bacterium]|jgi:hypothetical protein|nr:DUF4192 domain-containing protein [Propionibacteriaceae bacterium]
MGTEAGQTRSRITSQEELVAAIPRLLRAKPEESLVMVVTVDKLIAVTARMDIEDALQDRKGFNGLLSRIQQRFPDAEVFCVAISADPRLLHDANALVRGKFAEPSCKLQLADMVLVADNDSHYSAWMSKTELERRFAPPSEAHRDHLEGLSQTARQQLKPISKEDWAAHAMGLLDMAEPSDVDLCLAGMLLSHSRVREEFLLRHLSADNAAAMEDRLLDTLGVCLPIFRESVLEMLTLASWVNGGGTISGEARRTLEAEFPDARFLPVLHMLHEQIVNPNVWETMREWTAKNLDAAAQTPAQTTAGNNTSSTPDREAHTAQPASLTPAI